MGMRARSLKPGFFSNEVLGEADPIIPLTFAGVWCASDKAGRCEDRPKQLKGMIHPHRNVDMNGLLTVMSRLRFVRRYWHPQGGLLIQTLTFGKHQSPHHTERQSKLPAYDSRICKVYEDLESFTVESPLENGGYPSDSGLLTPDSGLLTTDPLAAQALQAGEGAESAQTSLLEPVDTDALTIELLVQTPGLNLAAVDEYRAYRREQGLKPLKARGMKLLVAQLVTYPLDVQQAMIDQSIRNTWQGVFELKGVSVMPRREARSSDELEAEYNARQGNGDAGK